MKFQKVHDERRKCLLEQLRCIRYLARQGIPLRNVNETEGNLIQLMKLSTALGMKRYLCDSDYQSPQINSELLHEMYRMVMAELLSQIKAAVFYAIVIDETRDVSGIEQLSVVIRWVSDDYTVFEDLVGMHQADQCDANSLVKILKSVLQSLGLEFEHIRGQTYDGASVLQGYKTGVAKQILTINPRALPTHCLNHSLNLVLQEAGSVNTIVSGAFSVVQSVCSIVRASPKRLAIFKNIQSATGGAAGTSIKPLCETRWCCRTSSLSSIISNYEVLLNTLEAICDEGGSTEGAKAAPGLQALMGKFVTVFGLKMCLLLFSPVEDMACHLQSKQLDASTVRVIKDSLLRYLNEMRSDEIFSKLFEDSKTMCSDLSLEQPSLPRRKRAPKKMRDYYGSLSTDHACDTVEQYYKTQFFEVIDLLTTQIKDRFDQDTLKYLISIEDLVVHAAKGEDIAIDQELEDKIKQDLNVDGLKRELQILSKYIPEVDPSLKDVSSISTVIDIMRKGKLVKMLSELHILLKLYLTVPLSNATAERSFSALRRVKTYLRSRLTQAHLNHFIILHCHKSLTDHIDLNAVMVNFVRANERRMKFFGL